MELRLLMLEALQGVPQATAWYRLGVGVLLLAFLAAALRPAWARIAPGGGATWFDGRRLFYVVTLAFVAWTRLPGLLAPLLNPDEGLFTAAAARLLNDPVFWRSVDTGSSGPLNIFPLTLVAALGLTPDLASSRLVGLLAIGVSTLLLHAALVQAYSEAAARLALVPVVATVAFVQHPDFVHYSGEHGPILLLSAIVWLLFRIGGRAAAAGRPATAPIFAIGLLAGLVPYAKMQGAPIALALCLVLAHLLWTRHRHDPRSLARQLAVLVAGGLLPTLAVAAFLWSYSIQGLFWNSYLQTNLFFYAGLKAPDAWAKLQNFGALLTGTSPGRWLLVQAAAAGVLSGVLVQQRRQQHRAGAPPGPPFVAYAVVVLLAAGFAAARPGNPFPHYLLLLVMPLGLFLGTLLGELERVRSGALPAGVPARVAFAWFGAGAALLAAPLLASRLFTGGHFLPQHGAYLLEHRGAVAHAIRRAAPAGSSMSMWGFSPGLFVESGMVQATRYGCTLWQIEPNPLQGDFIGEFVEDFERAAPLVFVDAMAPGMFYPTPVDRARHGHDAFARVAALIARNYDLAEEVQGVRIYRRQSQRRRAPRRCRTGMRSGQGRARAGRAQRLPAPARRRSA